MYKTIIVDDDFLVRSYLKQMGAWNRAGYEIAADLRDGEEALQEVKKQMPDVLVTDISMPLMDGIELIRHVREFNQSLYIIVLSCHDDFEYVKEAMKFGANEYVLKNSLDEDSLYEILKNAEHQMKERVEKSKESDETKKLIEMGRHSLKYHFFNSLLAGNISMDDREKKRREAGIKGKYINSAVINLFIPNWNELKSRYSELELDQYSQRFLQKLPEYLERDGDEAGYIESIYLGEGVFCCFLDLSEMRRSSLMRQRLTSAAAACFQCGQGETYTYKVGVSSICFGEQGIRQAYQQARDMMKMSFYEKGNILYYEGQPDIGRELPGSAKELLQKLPSIVEGQQYETLKKCFRDVEEDCIRCRTDVRLVLHWLKELDQTAGIKRSAQEYGAVTEIGQLLDICEEYHSQLFLERGKKVPKGAGPVIRSAVDYLHRHYKEQIGLTDVAEEVGLNPAYLSYLFKQEMEIGFSNYLLELRMECAKGMLTSTNKKVKDIAAESGFNDYHYFSRAFKKLYGVSPAEYRRQI